MSAGENGGARMTFSKVLTSTQRFADIPASSGDASAIALSDKAVDLTFIVQGECYAVVETTDISASAAFGARVTAKTCMKLIAGNSVSIPLAGLKGASLYIRSKSTAITEGITYFCTEGS